MPAKLVPSNSQNDAGTLDSALLVNQVALQLFALFWLLSIGDHWEQEEVQFVVFVYRHQYH